MEEEDALGHGVIASVGVGRGGGGGVSCAGRTRGAGCGRETVVRCAPPVQLQVLCGRQEGAEGRCESCFCGGRDGRARRVGLAWAGQHEEVYHGGGCSGGGNRCVVSEMSGRRSKIEADAAVMNMYGSSASRLISDRASGATMLWKAVEWWSVIVWLSSASCIWKVGT